MQKYNRQQLNWLIEDCYEDMEQRYELIDYIIDLQENCIPTKKIENLLEEVYTDEGIGYELDKDEKPGAVRALRKILEDK